MCTYIVRYTILLIVFVGLSIHKDQPFILASCSRDSTVRLWSTYQVAALLPVNALAQRPLQEIFATASEYTY